MKKTLQSLLCYIVPMAFGGLLGTGCSTDTTYETIDLPSVAIEQTGAINPTECTVVLTPNALTDHFEYAIGAATDRAKFEAGTLETIKKQTGKNKLTAVFDNLDQSKTYTIFARAYTAANQVGPVASYVLRTNGQGYTITKTFVTDHSAGFSITCSSDYYRFRYALGTAADREAFEKGTMESQEMKERISAGTYYFDLKADTEYIFFAKGYDRNGKTTVVIETPVTTYKESVGDDAVCPGVTMTVKDINIIEGTIVFTPNKLCGSVAILISEKGANDEIINNEMTWGGDLFGMISGWYMDVPEMLTAYGDGVVEAKIQLPNLATNLELEAFVLTLDQDDKPFGVSYFEFQTPAEDPDAGTAVVTLTVTDITSTGATYTIKGNEHTLAYMYDTIEAAFWDDFILTPDYHKDIFGYMATMIQTSNAECVYTEKYGNPGTRYYAAAIPMNANGPVVDLGWGETIMVEYTTLGAAQTSDQTSSQSK